MKYYTLQKPPILKGEVSSLPSVTRQSDTMDIKETIASFFRQGGVIPQQMRASDLTEEEREAIFDSPSEDELLDADIVDQKNYVEDVQGQIAKSQNVVEEKETSKEEKEEKANDSLKGE